MPQLGRRRRRGSVPAQRRALRPGEQLFDTSDDELRFERFGENAVAPHGRRLRLIDGLECPVRRTTGICAKRACP
jgi:hypothetical protein